MWELDCEESWVPKNWCFWTVVMEKTLESPLDCKEIQPVHPKGDQSCVFIWRLMWKLKLQYFGHLLGRADSLEKTLMLGGIGGRRRRGWQSMRWLDDIADLMDMGLGRLQNWWWTGRPGALIHGVVRSWTWLSGWTELNSPGLKIHSFQGLGPALSSLVWQTIKLFFSTSPETLSLRFFWHHYTETWVFSINIKRK